MATNRVPPGDVPLHAVADVLREIGAQFVHQRGDVVGAVHVQIHRHVGVLVVAVDEVVQVVAVVDQQQLTDQLVALRNGAIFRILAPQRPVHLFDEIHHRYRVIDLRQ